MASPATMLRHSSRGLGSFPSASRLPSAILRAQRHQRRTLITPPAHRPRSWKSSFARWAIAGAGVYWYANSDIRLFEDRTRDVRYAAEIDDVPSVEQIMAVDEEMPTLEEVIASRRQREEAVAAKAVDSGKQMAREVAGGVAAGAEAVKEGTAAVAETGEGSEASGSASPALANLEEEASSESAFNEETGEINWECPCLGGMAHGPCGEQFRAAFSCFVYSSAEPKGVDCIDKFKTMQDCFREHPDVYGAELTDMDEEDAAADALDVPPPADGDAVPAPAKTSELETTPAQPASSPQPKSTKSKKPKKTDGESSPALSSAAETPASIDAGDAQTATTKSAGSGSAAPIAAPASAGPMADGAAADAVGGLEVVGEKVGQAAEKVKVGVKKIVGKE